MPESLDLEGGYRLDKRRVRASFDRAAAGYDAVAVLQKEVGERLLERLGEVRLAPRVVVDVGSGTGQCTGGLVRRYPGASVIALDIAPAMLALARRRAVPWLQRIGLADSRPGRRLAARLGRQAFVCADAESLPFADASVDLLFSNLTLQWCGDLAGTFAEARRVLRSGGLIQFSTFGPDTLKELREAWGQVDGHNHVNLFFDMHDIGDAMVRAGLAEPVLDVDRMTLTYPDVLALMRDLKAMGAHNVSAGRPRGMTSRKRLAALAAAYEAQRRDGLLPATWEVVYGHAWISEAPSRRRRPDGVATVSLDGLRRRPNAVAPR
jgi:malonyl-CoA O-methyltransferase